jgi:predicted lipoprotein with Yx(FWY)xxD motif
MTVNSMGRLGIGVAVVALATVVAGCGSSKSSGGGGTATLAPAKNVAASSLQTQSTKIGSVLVNSKGMTIYELAGDTAANQTCNSSCQAFWPPVTSGGSQLVINGHPAFTFAEDSAAGQVHGQGVKDTWGTWWVLNASGNPITGSPTSGASPNPSASSTSTGSGGYGY